MVTSKQLRELKHNMKNMEEWELFEWLSGDTLDKGQLDIWKKSEDFDELPAMNVVLAHRGYGKSYLEGAHRFIKMISTPNWQSYTIYPKIDQAKYSLRYTKEFLTGNPYTSWMQKKATNWGETLITLPNKSFSFVISPSSRTATGYHVNQGYVGEAARWADDWDEIFYSAIMPMVNRKKGIMWLTSSAYGERGFFYNEFKKGDSPDTHTHKYTVNDTDIFDAKTKNRFRERLGSMRYRQEYLCEFLGSAETFIQPYIINKQSKMLPIISWSDLASGGQNVDFLGLDPGRNFDKFGICGINKVGRNVFDVVLYEEIQNDAYGIMTHQLKEIQQRNPKMKIFMESTGNQIMYLDWLRSEGIRVDGVEFGNKRKQEMYQRLEGYLRSGQLFLPSNNDLCMENLRYIPYQLRGTHISFPDEKIGGHHALHAMVVINLGLSKANFALKGL